MVKRWASFFGKGVLPPRGKSLKLEMRLICGISSTVNQLQIEKKIKQLNGVIVQLGKRPSVYL